MTLRLLYRAQSVRVCLQGNCLSLQLVSAFVSRHEHELEVNLDQIPTDTALGIAITAAVFLWVLPSLVHAWTVRVAISAGAMV